MRCSARSVGIIALLFSSASGDTRPGDPPCLDYSGRFDWLGAVDTPGRARAVTISGDFVFVADRSGGLRVVDASNARSPRIVGSANTPGYAEAVAVLADLVVVACGAAGIQIVDVGDPESPEILADLPVPDRAHRVAVSGTLCCVASRLAGLQVVDIADPENPVIVGSVDTPGVAVGVAFGSTPSWVLVADGSAGVQVVSIADPTDPQILASVDTPWQALDVEVSGSYAYVVGDSFEGSGLEVIDIGVPTLPVTVATVPLADVVDVAVADDLAYVAWDGYSSGFTVFDVSDPFSPWVVVKHDTRESFGVAVGSHACIAAGEVGVEFFDVDDLRSPTVTGTLRTRDRVRGVAATGTHAYVGGQDHLYMVDLANPTQPVIVGTANPLLFGFHDVSVSGSYVYATEAGVYASWITVFDVSDPTSPAWASYIGTGNPTGTARSGDYLYVANRNAYWDGGGTPARFTVTDVADPTDPQGVASVQLDVNPGGIAASEGHAWIAGGLSGLLVFDLEVPSAPQLVAVLDTIASALEIAISGGIAYVVSAAAEGPTLFAIDTSVPDSPQVVGSAAVPGTGKLALSGDHLWIGATPSLILVDVSDPSDPIVCATVDSPGPAFGITMAGDRICVAAGPEGLVVLPGHCTATRATGVDRPDSRPDAALSVFPNPVSGACTIRFAAPRSGRVRASVYDVRGRLVRALRPGRLEAGPHVLTWDGRDGGGRSAAAGVYFVRVEGPELSAGRRLVVIR